MQSQIYASVFSISSYKERPSPHRNLRIYSKEKIKTKVKNIKSKHFGAEFSFDDYCSF